MRLAEYPWRYLRNVTAPIALHNSRRDQQDGHKSSAGLRAPFAAAKSLASGGICLSPASGSTLLPGKQGIFALGAPLIGPILLGPVTNADGRLALSFTVPNPGFGPEDALLVHQQAFVKPVADSLLLSSPTAAVLVDDSF